MTIEIKHPFISLKSDGGDATLIRPSNWNANHSTSMSTNRLVGRLTSGVGAFEEIPITAYMASLLNTADLATLAGLLGLFETGDVKYTFKTTAPTGWLLVTANGSIGAAGSAATLLASSSAQALYILLWDALSNTLAPVSGGRGASGAADFAALKTLTLPQLQGKAPIAAGSAGTGTSARVLGTGYGAEGTMMTAAQIASHSSSGNNTITVASTVTDIIRGGGASRPNEGGPLSVPSYTASQQITSTGNNAILVSYTNGAQEAIPVMQPSIALNLMVKL